MLIKVYKNNSSNQREMANKNRNLNEVEWWIDADNLNMLDDP